MDPLRQFFIDYPQYMRARKVPAWYSITYTPLLASAQLAAQQVIIGADADFIATSATISVTTAVTNAAYIQTPLLISLVYAAYNTNLTSTVVDISSMFQTMPMHDAPNAQFPYPLIVPRATQLTTQVTNPIAADCNVWITFAGIKIYNQQQ